MTDATSSPGPDAAPSYTTADQVPLTPGMCVWDNNLDAVRVIELAHWPATDREPAWHLTVRLTDRRKSHADDSRLAYRHPFSRRTVAEELGVTG